MSRDWTATCWSLGAWLVPAPFAALLGQLAEPGPGQAVVGLVLAAAASLALGTYDLQRCGWVVPARAVAASAVGLAATVSVGLLVAEAWGREALVVQVCVALGLPHVALAGLAWPGPLGLVQRVAVATALVGPAAVPAFAVGFPLVLLTGAVGDGTLGFVVAFALGQLLVLVGGTVVARPVALQRAAPAVPALA